MRALALVLVTAGCTNAYLGSTSGDGWARTDGTGGDNAITGDSAGDPATLPLFSFFVTSLEAMVDLSGSADGFGGDLRFGETGPLTQTGSGEGTDIVGGAGGYGGIYCFALEP